MLEEELNPQFFPFQKRQAVIELRKKLLAEAIGRGDDVYQDPKGGTMIGSGVAGVAGVPAHYVAPSWSQYLAAYVKPIAARQEIERLGQEVGNEEQLLSEMDRKAAIEHIANRPQTITPFDAAPVEPTDQQMLEYAAKGVGIPSRRKTVEALMLDAEINGPIRQERRVIRAEDREDRQAEARALLKLKEEDLERGRIDRGENLAQDRVDRAYREAEDRKLRRMMIENAANKTEAKESKGKLLSPKTVNDFGEMDERASMLENLLATFKDEYSGPVAAVKSTVSPYVPGMDTASANWWRDYKKQQELIERHALFGATLTKPEQVAWRKADISEWMRPEVIKENLATRAALADKIYQKALGRYDSAGYDVKDQGRESSGPLKVGDVRKGYRYVGGDPSKESSWTKP